MKIINVLLSVLLFLLVSCKDNPDNYYYIKTPVTKVQPLHWGKGLYNELVYYEYTFEGEKYSAEQKFNSMTKTWKLRFHEGDTILIRFPKNDYEKSEIIKVKYSKRLEKQIDG